MVSSQTSDSGDGILLRLAERVDSTPVTVQELARWLESGGCPGDVARQAAWSTLGLVAKSYNGSKVTPPWAESTAYADVASGLDEPVVDGRILKEIALPDNPDTNAAITLDPEQDAVVIHYRSRVSSPDGTVVTYIDSASSVMTCTDLAAIWNSLPTEQRPLGGFPLDVLYQAWLKRPKVVVPTNRTTGRIMPATLAHISPQDSRAGRLFSVAARTEVASDNGAQLSFGYLDSNADDRQVAIMPGFQDPKAVGPCLPLALYDLGDAPSLSPGPSAPLPLRIFVEAVLAVPLESRDGTAPVVMEVPLRDLLDSLYPGTRRPRPSEYWPRLMAAFEALESPAARVPWVDMKTGQGGMQRIVNITSIPRNAHSLDDKIRFIVDLPPGSGFGPQVSDNLRYWGVKSGGAYRALLNLAYHWFEPGRTHAPVRRGGKKHWLGVNDPERYPAMDNDALITLCFPSSVNARRNVAVRARTILQQLEQAGELRIVDAGKGLIKVLPPTTSRGDEAVLGPDLGSSRKRGR